MEWNRLRRHVSAVVRQARLVSTFADHGTRLLDPEFPLDYEPFPMRTEISLSHLLRNTQQIWNTAAMDGFP